MLWEVEAGTLLPGAQPWSALSWVTCLPRWRVWAVELTAEDDASFPSSPCSSPRPLTLPLPLPPPALRDLFFTWPTAVWRREWPPTPVFVPGKWTEEPSGLQPVGSRRVGYDLVTRAYTHTHTLSHSHSPPPQMWEESVLSRGAAWQWWALTWILCLFWNQPVYLELFLLHTWLDFN